MQHVEEETHLEKKLTIVSEQIGMYARIITGFSIVSHIAFMIIYLIVVGENPFSDKSLLQWVEIGIIALVILIVAIPEGLPVAISLAMALSTDKLKHQQILIKNVQSIQTCAMVHDVCVGKTGCLTKGNMNVRMYQITNQVETNDHIADNNEHRDNFYTKLVINDDLKELIIDSMLNNNDTRMESTSETLEKVPVENKNFWSSVNYENIEEHIFEPKGTPIEQGITQFLVD
jgi:magnesium-transporting ATPase (P-type)